MLALEIAAAGGHHMLMVGPQGGRASRAGTPCTRNPSRPQYLEALEVAAITASLRGEHPAPLPVRPPFAAPHHTASSMAMVGGGSVFLAREPLLRPIAECFPRQISQFAARGNRFNAAPATGRWLYRPGAV